MHDVISCFASYNKVIKKELHSNDEGKGIEEWIIL